MPNPLSCGTLLLSPDKQRCVLVKQRDTGKWGVPKGSVKPRESTVSAMEREFWEETGVILTRLHTKTINVHKFKRYLVQTVILISFPDKMMFHPRDTQEISEAQWVSCQYALRELPLNCVTKHMLERELRFQTQKSYKK
jgi:8-oxo-dGTP pyrophosphatase MutT (NUDIX family)